MRKFFRCFAITATVFSCCFIDHSGLAQEKTVPKVLTVPLGDSVPISRLFGEAAPDVSRPQPDSPAPPLTRIFINNVCVDQGATNCEYTYGLTQTANTYHGTAAYVFAWEIGYGQGPYATEGGAQMSNADDVNRAPICIVNNYYTVNCPVGSTVVGFRYEWWAGDLASQGFGGRFYTQDTSDVAPINTYNASITILYSH